MIKRLEKHHLNRLIDIWLKASKESHSFINYEYWERNSMAMKTIYLPSAKTYVYETDKGEIAGFISFAGNTIAAIFIDPDFQRRGYGKELIDFAKNQYESLELFVYALNQKALKFYLREEFIKKNESVDTNTGETQFKMVFKRKENNQSQNSLF
ncbi:MAG: GNAT family N-acetyltransferase [Bacteroidales bacterium]|nr:GNAT family N-acetyltransferase [Bacteroidales bacterium]